MVHPDYKVWGYFNTKDLFFYHRVNDPAVIYSNGTREWYVNNFLFNFKKPSVIYSNGDCEYWHFGMRHRDDGPAVIIGNKQYWYSYGKFEKCIV
jgi:hypothetical protein